MKTKENPQTSQKLSIKANNLMSFLYTAKDAHEKYARRQNKRNKYETTLTSMMSKL